MISHHLGWHFSITGQENFELRIIDFGVEVFVLPWFWDVLSEFWYPETSIHPSHQNYFLVDQDPPDRKLEYSMIFGKLQSQQIKSEYVTYLALRDHKRVDVLLMVVAVLFIRYVVKMWRFL